MLQERVVERVGSNHPREIDMRLVSATNRDLEAMIEGGQFRRDLFYRLRVVQIPMPPLRALEDTKHVKARAARVLGVSERSLWYKLKKHGLS